MQRDVALSSSISRMILEGRINDYFGQRCRNVIISGCWNKDVYRGVLILGCCNRGLPLYTEVSSFQGVGIEGFHCIQRCLPFKGIGQELSLSVCNIKHTNQAIQTLNICPKETARDHT